MIRRGIMTVALLLLTSCSDLDTTYASRGDDSVNGIRILDQSVAARAEVRRAYALSPRLDQHCELILHVATRDDLPDKDTADWITDWLSEKPRQMVLILRDGNVAPWLCRRWAAEARSEAGKLADPTSLKDMADRLELRAKSEETLERMPGSSTSTSLFTRIPGPDARPRAIIGLGDPAVPEAMLARHGLHADDGESLATLVLADGSKQVWALSIDVGNQAHSRLLVIANATPLLDGAQPDPAARRLLGALLDEIFRWHGQSRKMGNAKGQHRPEATWVRSLRVREGEPEQANPMAMIFTKPPFAVVTWHLVGLAALALLALAAQLGRRTAPGREHRASFGRHVEALARQLAEGNHAAGAADAITRARNLPPSPRPQDAASARAWLASADRPPESRP